MLRQCRTANKLVEVTKFKFFFCFECCYYFMGEQSGDTGFYWMPVFSLHDSDLFFFSAYKLSPTSRPPNPIFLPHACFKVLLSFICIFLSYFNQQKAKRSERKKLLSTYESLAQRNSIQELKRWYIGTYSNLLLSFKFHILAIS